MLSVKTAICRRIVLWFGVASESEQSSTETAADAVPSGLLSFNYSNYKLGFLYSQQQKSMNSLNLQSTNIL